MLQNAIEFEPNAVVEADTCIIGSGPAGLAIALQLAKRGLGCVMLETGLREFDDTHQSVGQLDSSYAFGNLQERQLDERRQIGGKSNAWSIETDKGSRGVRLLPYVDANFEPRPAMGGIAWPITYGDLELYYKAAADFFEVPGTGWTYSSASNMPLASPALTAVRFRFSDGEVLSRHIRDSIIPSDRIRLICNATAVKLALDPDTSAIGKVHCESDPGRPFTLRARQVVIAGGALSTTGLLLRSDDVIPGGIGNQNGLLGRYFMDHPLIDGGQLIVSNPAIFETAASFDIRRMVDGLEMAHLQLPQEVIRNEPVANINAMLYPRARIRNLSQAHQNGRRAAQKAWQDLKNPRSTPMKRIAATIGVGLRAPHVLNHFFSQQEERNARINRGGWSQQTDVSRRYRAFQILHISEQAPHFDNRVRLGDQRDRFGQRRVTIDWTLGADEKAAIRRAQNYYVDAFRKGGWGEYQILSDNGDPELVHSSLGHHIGTTRMHTDPKRGVTDANAKVHGVDNLFVASSSLFPSGGWENPTLTVVALAIRLADHLAARSEARVPLAAITGGSPQHV